MRTEAILLVVILETTSCYVVKCDVLQDGNENVLKKDKSFLHKIADDDFMKSLIEYKYKGLHYPITIPSHQLAPVNIDNVMLNHQTHQARHQEYYLFYSIPVHGELSTSNLLPITSYNSLFDFTNTFKDSYENNNHMLRDNSLDYYYLPLIPNTIDYLSTSGYQNNFYGGPLNNISPYQSVSYVNDLPTRPFSKFPGDFKNSTGLNYQNFPFDYSNHKPHVSVHPQQYQMAAVFPPLQNRPPQSQKPKSPNVEIVKAIGYELPVKNPTRQPVPLTRSYIFDSESTIPLKPSEKEKKSERNEWKGILNEDTKLYENTFMDPIIVGDDEDEEQPNKISFNQYFLSNRKPITFEPVQEEILPNIESANEITRKNSPPTYDFADFSNITATKNESITYDFKSDHNVTETSNYSRADRNIT